MSAPYSKAAVKGPDGALHVALDPELAAVLRPGASLDAISYGEDGLLLLRQGASPSRYFAGSLLSMSLAEVFGHVMTAVRTGRLVVAFGAARRTVTFRDGQVTFATSTEPHERLGSALVRLGLLERREVEEALSQVKPGIRLGQVLTGSGRLAPAVLYGAMTFLVREIIVDLFQLASGEFLFIEGPPAEDVLRLPERTRDLVAEGLRRGEETAQLRQKLGPELRVRAGKAQPPAERVRLRAAAAPGPLELPALRASFEGGDHAFLSAVDEALRSGELEAVPQPRAPAGPRPRGEPRTTLQLYGELIERICTALREAGKDLAPLRSFLEEPQPGTEKAFQGVRLGDGGQLDVERVLSNLSPLGAVVGRARAYEVLNGFISFALFTARNELPPRLAAFLEQQVLEIMRQVPP